MRVHVVVALAGLAIGVLGCEGRKWSDIYKDQERAEIPKVPYLVNTRTKYPSRPVNLWKTPQRSAKKPINKVPYGTKIAKILDTYEMDRTRGGTMYKIKMVTGEVGWIPHFCLEHRRK